MAAFGNCLADPPADSACTAEEVTVGSAAVAADEDPEGISEDCLACVFARTLRKGVWVQDAATSDIELCGPPAAAQTCEEGYLARWADENDGYGTIDGVCGYDFSYCSGDDDTSAECTACIDKVNAELANKADRFCNPPPHCSPTPLVDTTGTGGPTVCTYADKVDANGDEYWTSYEPSLEECVATIMALFPEAADRENMVITYWDDYDDSCDDPDGLCFGDCYVELDVDRDGWNAEVPGDYWESCFFDATYDDEAAISAAEAACQPEPEPTKTSSAPTVAASVVGMIVSALVTATFN